MSAMVATTGQARREALMQSISDAIQALADETDEARAGESLARYFATLSKFYHYSLHNQILIWLQKPDATLVAGFKTWEQKFRRWVKKGEKGIAILAPRVYNRPGGEKEKSLEQANHATLEDPLPGSARSGGQGEEKTDPGRRVCFTTVYVFDVSQTDGEALPEEPPWRERAKDPEVESGLLAFANRKGILVEIVAEIRGGAEGCSFGGKIQLLPETGTHTFVHELAHELYEHSRGDVRQTTNRQQREIEADAAAHVVCRHFGISSLSPNYLALWQANREDILSCLERVRGLSVEIIEAVESHMETHNH